MDNFSLLLQGLLLTLVLALLPAVIGVALGIPVLNGKNRRHGVLYWISTAYIELFRGIPLLIQLPFIYYVIPAVLTGVTIPELPTAIIVFTLNAAAAFPSAVRNARPVDPQDGDESLVRIKTYILASVEILRKTFIYSAFAGILAINDLYFSATAIDSADGKMTYVIIAVVIYLIVSLGLRLVQKGMSKSFFPPAPPVLIEESETGEEE